ncbi:MAG: MFS transporter [Eubacteriales bacterium]|nr:MFS transporter [Eubacteriales bacterium]MDD3290668.1 MFS transporter [Eubacteriales bacterium]MDD3863090.1 MFS transporter [Eubacteriales bacterium]
MTDAWKKQTILFLTSQTVSLFGSTLVQYAILWHITLETQSGVMMTLSIVCGFLPAFFVSPFAGIWADRYDRKKLIVAADALIALVTLIIALLLLGGHESFWLLFLAMGIRSFGTGVQTPAVNAFLPQIVPADQLLRVNGINGSIQSLITLSSPVASGALMSLVTLDKIFLIDVGTAGIAIVILLLFLRVPAHAKAFHLEQTSYWKDLQEGFRYIGGNGFVKRSFIHCAVYFILIAPLAFLTPLQVARSFGPDVWRLTVIEVTFSLGMMAGGLFIAAWGGFSNRLHTIAVSSLVTAGCTFALGWPMSFVVYSVLMGILGLAMLMFQTPFTVLLQEKVDGDYMGRVFGVLGMLSSSLMPLAMLIFGPLADRIPIERLLIATGALLGIQSVLMLFDAVLFEAGKPFQKGEK